MKKLKLATVWLDGCSGCHMSLLDMDAGILAVAQKAELVYGPLVDAQEFPDEVDVTLVEGAVSTDEDVAKIQRVRQCSRILVALGDCAVTGNVPSMRNPVPVARLLERVYVEGADEQKGLPSAQVPHLQKQARPLRDYVQPDVFVPGCPPAAQAIVQLLNDLLDRRKPEVSAKLKFG